MSNFFTNLNNKMLDNQEKLEKELKISSKKIPTLFQEKERKEVKEFVSQDKKSDKRIDKVDHVEKEKSAKKESKNEIPEKGHEEILKL